MLDFPEMNRQTRLPRPEQYSLSAHVSWLRLLHRLDTLATLCGDKTLSHNSLPCQISSAPLLSAVTVPTSLPRSQPSFVLLLMQDKKQGWQSKSHRTLFFPPKKTHLHIALTPTKKSHLKIE